MSAYTKSMQLLINELKKLPGIGSKTAERLALYLIMKSSVEDSKALAYAVLNAREKTKFCKICFNLSEEDICHICKDATRDNSIICVIEKPLDVTAIEKVATFKGLYHVLGGSLSPLDGIGPDDLKIKELINRIKEATIKEVIIATNSDMEGEATALYLVSLLKPLGVKISRIAYGIPVGTNLEYTDQASLIKALDGRRQL